MLVAIVIPFILTLIVGKRKLAATGSLENGDVPVVATTPGGAVTAAVKDYKEGEIRAFLSGNVIKIEDVPDQVFAEKIMATGSL